MISETPREQRVVISRREVADQLGCSEKTVMRYSQEGKLPPVLEFGKLRVMDFAAFVRSIEKLKGGAK